MLLTNQIILLIGALLLVSVLASVLSARAGLPVLLIFLTIGMLLGVDGPGGVDFQNYDLALLIGSTALAVILFDGGLRTEYRAFRVALWPAVSLATAGVLITALVTGGFAAWILDLPLLYGVLLGAIVGSTDAAAVFSMLRSQGVEIQRRVGYTLEIESGTNDPMAIFLTVVTVELLAAGKSGYEWGIALEFIQQMGIGGAFGIAGGIILAWGVNRLSLNPGLYPLLALAGGLTVFGAAAFAGGSGFLAAYVAGLVFGNRRHQAAGNIRRFHDGIAWLSQIALFLVLGLLAVPSDLLAMAPAFLLIATVLIFLARPIAVVLCLLPFGYRPREHAFIAWVGLRGAVPIVLAIFPLLAGVPNADVFFNAAFFVVLVSLLLQGTTLPLAARWLGLELPPGSELFQRTELDIPGRIDYELVGYLLAEESPVIGRSAERLVLPEHCTLAAVFREDTILSARQAGPLQAGDQVFLMAPAHDLRLLDRLFVAFRAPERLESKRIFGEFALNAEARLKDLADLYGFENPRDAPEDISVGAYLEMHLGNRVVVGDRLRVGNVELVIRELEDDRITKVGLKLAAV